VSAPRSRSSVRPAAGTSGSASNHGQDDSPESLLEKVMHALRMVSRVLTRRVEHCAILQRSVPVRAWITPRHVASASQNRRKQRSVVAS